MGRLDQDMQGVGLMTEVVELLFVKHARTLAYSFSCLCRSCCQMLVQNRTLLLPNFGSMFTVSILHPHVLVFQKWDSFSSS